METFDENKLYQKIGEFVVSFQWVENLVRQIGHACIDPNCDKPMLYYFGEESNNPLLIKVADIHDRFLEELGMVSHSGYTLDFRSMINKLHDYRKFRNTLLHSVFVEIKAGGEILDIVRFNSKNKISESQKKSPELSSIEEIDVTMKMMAEDAFQLSTYLKQLIHWYGAKERVTYTAN